MTTSRPLTLTLFEEEYPSSVEDFPVPISPSPEKAQDSEPKTLPPSAVASGSRCSELSELSDRLCASARTYLLSILAGSTPYSLVWKRRDTPALRSWWVLGRPARPKNGIASGLSLFDETLPDDSSETGKEWQTPRATVLHAESLESWQARHDFKVANKMGGGACSPDLGLQVQIWQTPRSEKVTGESMEAWTKRYETGSAHTMPLGLQVKINWPNVTASNGGANHQSPAVTERGHGTNLAGAIQTNWPTPISTDGKNNGAQGMQNRNTPQLNAAVLNWPTPASQTDEGGAHGLDGGSGSRAQLEQAIGPEESRLILSQQLNADWVEQLQNFPPGWTAIDSLPVPEWTSKVGKRRARSQRDRIRRTATRG